ncbi:class I SAM-dependent methyltransferase, partial [Candidatus Bipolaricaulota bacterium]|nr:class I SAM-dependent methyltransferase [Candidatus Bipolaricaulota bacterium]
MLACFLEYIARADRSGLDDTVLDCGGGGSTPPLAMFAERGYTCTGIAISEKQVASARACAEERDLPMTFDVGDMRALPYPDASFSYVYEIESMCHLTKADTRRAIGEMTRVLKPGGYLFAHFMSDELWPITGEEVGSGEFRGEEDGEIVVHSFFTDEEVAEQLS